ncbi:hypothetical protein D3C80_1058220 [compost metagenome]
MTGGGQGQDQRRDDQGRRQRARPLPAAPIRLDPAPGPSQQVDRRVQGGGGQQALDLVGAIDAFQPAPSSHGLGQIGLEAERQFASAQGQVGAEEGGAQGPVLRRLGQDQAVGDHDVGLQAKARQIVAPGLQQAAPDHRDQPSLARRRNRPQRSAQPVGGRGQVVAQQMQRRRRDLRRTARGQVQPADQHVGAGNHGDGPHGLGRRPAQLDQTARQHAPLRVQRQTGRRQGRRGRDQDQSDAAHSSRVQR